MLVSLRSGRRMFIDVDGEGFVIDGRGMRPRSTVVLVHGAEADHSFFKPWVTPLTEFAQLVYVDLIGHGRSDPGGPDDWNHRAFAQAVGELCDIVGLEDPVVLGSSMGGRVALDLAITRAHRMRGLVLVNTVGVVRIDRRIEMYRRLGGDAAADAARRHMESPSDATRAAFAALCLPHLTRRPYSGDEIARIIPPAPGALDRLVELGRADATCSLGLEQSGARPS